MTEVKCGYRTSDPHSGESNSWARKWVSVEPSFGPEKGHGIVPGSILVKNLAPKVAELNNVERREGEHLCCENAKEKYSANVLPAQSRKGFILR